MNELQKLDSSRGLILQSTSEGEGGSGEMAGFFYRTPKLLEIWRAALRPAADNTLVKIDKSDSGLIVRALTEIEKADAFGSLDVSLERMKFNEYSLILQLISDHIPVAMSCRKDLQDDD